MPKPKSSWPARVEIGGGRWLLRVVSGQLGDTKGDTDPDTHTIRVSAGPDERETLIHELIHTIGDSLGLEPSERTTCTLTHAISGFCRHNRALILKILED